MNAVEIEQAITDLALQPFDPVEFPYAFLQAFGNKQTTLKRLRSGATNKSDLSGVLQTSNIHLAVCEAGDVTQTLAALKSSPATTRAKAKFVLATDGETLEAEELGSGETVACSYPDFPDHFGFFLPLAGISTVKQIRENSFDIRATSRLNRLYVELLKDNPAWGTAERRHEMNHFMARLIFCFFAEDTDIFNGTGLFTDTLVQMCDRDAANLHEVIGEIFRAMNTPIAQRATANIPRWADTFPYVNGGLFSDSLEVPLFTKIARSYLLHIGALDWKLINPDIFGSMIQAVADDEERGALGMHYTSVPNILKVLNPLFLDELRAKLEESGDNARTLLNLRKRLARIRVFDPACGSGNFLVIAYKQLREIENTINERRGELGRRSDIPITNFRGIELRDFSAEVARLALIIAEYQCDVLYRGQKEALLEFLPLSAKNWITSGNALRIDWLSVCPPTGTDVKLIADDLFEPSLERVQIDFENEGGETYICGNPPYIGGKKQSAEQKKDMKDVLGRDEKYKNLDYVCAFIIKTCDLLRHANKAALVTTNSVVQGTHVPTLWPMIYRYETEVEFSYETFKWDNNAQKNAGVSCTIIGLTNRGCNNKRIYGAETSRLVRNINAYLIEGSNIIVEGRTKVRPPLSQMITGNAAYDEGHLFLTPEEARCVAQMHPEAHRIIRRVYGTSELVDGTPRFCLWIDDDDLHIANAIPEVSRRISAVLEYRKSGGEVARALVGRPHQFRYRNGCLKQQIVVPQVSSEKREYLPIGLLDANAVITHLAHVIYDGSLIDFAVLASKLHLAWVITICGKLETRIRYASNLGWNTFPTPLLTEKNKADLTRCAEDILLAREAHFPATIAELYAPEHMPDNLRAAHERNDEVLERIYIGRRFKNDTERLEKLFELYTEITTDQNPRKEKQ